MGLLQFPPAENQTKQPAFICSFLPRRYKEGGQGIISHPLPHPTPYSELVQWRGRTWNQSAAQPPFSQPARPTQWNTWHYKLLQLRGSDYFYGNLLQVQKWINDNFLSWLHFENQNWLLEKLLDFPAFPHQKTDYCIGQGWYNSAPNRFWAY